MGRILVLGFLVSVVGAMAYFGYGRWQENTAEEEGGRRGGGGLAVAIMVVEPQSFADIEEAIGTTRSNESVTITSRSTDLISRVAFDSGDRVATGQILVELANEQEAADLIDARATLDEVRRELERQQELVGRGVVAQSLVDTAQAEVERAEARLAFVEAQKAELVIRAPFDGLVGLRDASPGMLVRPGDPIVTLDDISVIKVDFTVPERFLSVIAEGDELTLSSTAFPDDVFVGAVDQIDTRVDVATRAVTIRALIDNPDGKLRPGMLMLVEVRRNQRSAPAVPEVAVTRRNDQAFVFVVRDREDGGMVVDRRTVQTGARRDGVIEITSGLQPGERVVSEGVHRLRPNMPVRLPAANQRGNANPREGRSA